MKFKKGDKVIIVESSEYIHQQKYDKNGNKIPFTIKDINFNTRFNYNTNESKLYNDEDLEFFNENLENISYEVY